MALIDDSLETALACNKSTDLPVILFGAYEWNKRSYEDSIWSFDEKVVEMKGQEWWKEDDVDISELKTISRAKDWDEVVARVRSLR